MVNDSFGLYVHKSKRMPDKCSTSNLHEERGSGRKSAKLRKSGLFYKAAVCEKGHLTMQCSPATG